MMLIFQSCIRIDLVNVLPGDKIKDEASSGWLCTKTTKMQKLRKPKKLHRKQLLKYSSCTALPTLRLLGIMIATQYANFSLINAWQGA